MNKIIFSLIISTIANCNIYIFAQYSLSTITPNGPAHALMPGFSDQRVTPDTVFYISHVPDPFDKQIYNWDENSENPLITGYTIHKYSPDFLIDTIHVFSGLMRIDIKHFDDKYRTVRYLMDYPDCKIHTCYYESDYFYDLQEFEYDTENRVSKITNKRVTSVSGTETETLVSTDLFDYSTIKMTSKGYIYNGYECEMDALNRITYLKNLTEMPKGYYEPQEYMELNGKKYRVGDKYYTYFDGGVSIFGYERTSQGMLGWSDRWVKVDYFFNDEGLITFKNTYNSLDGETWEVWEKRETRYAYVQLRNTDVQNIHIDSSNVNVYGISGSIVVNSDNNAEVSIYNTTGQKICHQHVQIGTTTIPMNVKGLYFVIVDNKSHKVIVN